MEKKCFMLIFINFGHIQRDRANKCKRIVVHNKSPPPPLASYLPICEPL